MKLIELFSLILYSKDIPICVFSLCTLELTNFATLGTSVGFVNADGSISKPPAIKLLTLVAFLDLGDPRGSCAFRSE